MNEHAHFVDACLAAFRFLTERFDFGEPEVDPIGREVFVQYHRGDRTVSIAYEPRLSPIVELFQPVAGTDEEPLSWAGRDGVQRFRRIPRLRPQVPFSDANAEGFRTYLEESARALRELEADWLSVDQG